MNRLSPLRRPASGRTARLSLAILALAGAGLVQIGWANVLETRGAAGRPTSIALLLLASTYLLTSSWYYLQRAWTGYQAGEPRRLRQLSLFCDGMLSGSVLAILTRGHQSGTLGLGLWTVPPVLLTFSAIAACFTFATWPAANIEETAAEKHPGGPAGVGGYVRTVAAIALLGILFAVEIGGWSRSTFH